MTKTIKNTISKSELRKLFDYDAKRGVLLWKPRKPTCRGDRMFNSRFSGTVAGYIKPTGYRVIYLDGRPQLASRLIWAWHHGPAKSLIDHKDRDTTNDKIENLREATYSQNGYNRRVRKDSRTGLKGVAPVRDKFVARIIKDREYLHLGTYETAIEAHSAYLGAARVLHGEFFTRP